MVTILGRRSWLWIALICTPEVFSAEPASIRIGISNAQSGPCRSLGKQLVVGSSTYFDLVNRAGGVLGRPLAIVVEDDQYEPEPAVQNTFDLIARQHVLFLFDYVGTPTLTRTLPILKYYERENVVNVAPLTGADPQRRPPYDRFVFNIRASYRDEMQELVTYLVKQGFRKIGFLGQADAYGKAGEVALTEALASHALRISGTATYRRNQSFETSMQPQVDILRKAHADAVIAVGVYGPCGAFIRDARLTGWYIPIANLSFVGADALLDLLTAHSRILHKDLTFNLLNSQVVPSPQQSAHPLAAAFRQHVTAEYVSFVGLEGWLNAVVVVEALRRAGPNPTRSGFIKAMESLGGWDPGLGARLAFSPTSHTGLHRVWLTRTVDGHWAEVQ